MNYLNPTDSISAAHWNDLFEQADAQLTTMLGGLSALFAGVDQQFDRGFFFGFDPVNLPVSLHEKAFLFLRNYTGDVYKTSPFYLRQYNHAAITGQVSGLSQLLNSSKFRVVKLSRPTWAAWSAAIYPSGFGSISAAPLQQTISGTVYPVDNCLDVSLQVHKVSVSGTPYFVSFGGRLGDVPNAEHPWPYKAVDVYTLGSFSWDNTNWDKYSFVRLHNVGRTACTATFGSATATVNAGASKCFRKIATGWIVCGNYFHWMQPGDGRFIKMLEGGLATPPGPGSVSHGSAPSCFMPGVVTDVLLAVVAASYTNFGKQPDLTKFYDMTPLYNNAAYVKSQANENDPPVGGYFPTPTAATLLGDLIIPRGKYLVANRAVPTVVHASMTVTVAQTAFFDGSVWIAPLLIAGFVDGQNVVANVSNIVVTNQTTGQTINAYSDPADPDGPNLGSTANWRQLGDSGLAIIVRGSIYNGAAWVPVTPVPSGFFAPFISQGDVLKVKFDYVPADDHVMVDFDGFANLATKLAGAGVTTRALVENGGTLNNLEIYTAGGWHMIDLSCPLVTFLTNGAFPARILGTTQAATPPSLKLPWLKFTAITRAATNLASNFSYGNWARDSTGKLVGSSVTTVTINQAGSSETLPSTVFLPTDSASTVFGWIQSQSQAGGILSVENLRFLSTTFGHVMLFDEVWPLDSKFDGVSNSLPTLSIVYEGGHLRVTRMIMLETTNYVFTANGIFPQIGTSAGYMYWHYARVDRHFAFARWFQTLSADNPEMFALTGFWNVKLLPVDVWDDLSNNEFNYVQSFYETNPITADVVTIARPHRKYGISRMGRFSLAADIWTPFSYWLQKIPTLVYPNGASSASISTQSGWYFLNKDNVIANSTISQPLQSIPPCQVEHYNSIASLVNGTQPFKYKVNPGPSGWSGWNYTLDFTLANVVLISGGLGYVAGDILNFGLKVASVDANGTITGLAQNGTAYIGTFAANNTISRPFDLGKTLTGNGAYCDTTVGDGSGLSFIPPRLTVGVAVAPAPPTGTMLADFAARLTDSYAPRPAFFSWHGATAGCADPVADYLSSMGVGVQTSVPDSYGTPLSIKNYDLSTTGGVSSSRVSSYQYGCDTIWQLRVQSYRWISIDDARSLYSSLSLPFVLNELLVPFRWQVFNVTGSVTTLVDTSLEGHGAFNYTIADTDYNRTNLPDKPRFSTCQPYNPPSFLENGQGDLGQVNQIQADFYNDPDGQWVRSYRNENICSKSSPLAEPIRSWWSGYETIGNQCTADYDFVPTGCTGPTRLIISFEFDALIGTFDYSQHTVQYKIEYAIPVEFTPAGFVLATYLIGGDPTKVIMRYPNKLTYDLIAVLARFEGVPGKLICAVPQNVAYYDEAWVASTLHTLYPDGVQIDDLLLASGNPLYCPIIADNTVELSSVEATFISGAGGAELETLITSGLTNARLLTVSVDNESIPQNNPPPAGI